MRRLVSGTRAIDDGDLNPPHARPTPSPSTWRSWTARVRGAWRRCRQLASDLGSQLGQPTRPISKRCATSMLRAATLRRAQAPSRCRGGRGSRRPQTLVAQALDPSELANRVDAARGARRATAATPEARRDLAAEQLRLVFGKRSSCCRASRRQRRRARACARRQRRGAARRRARRLSLVPAGCTRARRRRAAQRALTYAEALGRGEQLAMSIAQLPHDTGERWVGLPLAAGQRCRRASSRSSCRRPADRPRASRLPGCSSTSGSRSCPSRRRPPASRFSTTSPNAAPPQAILLAVPPDPGSRGRCGRCSTCCSKRSTCAHRAVDPDALDEIGHYLPALYFAMNTAADTVSTDFTTGRAVTERYACRRSPAGCGSNRRSRDADMKRQPAGADLRSALAARAAVADRRIPGRGQRLAGDGALARQRRRRSPAITPAPITPNTRSTPAATTRDHAARDAWSSARPSAAGDGRASRRSCAWPRKPGKHFLRLLEQQPLSRATAPCSSRRFAFPPLTRRRSAPRSTRPAWPTSTSSGRACRMAAVSTRRSRAAPGGTGSPCAAGSRRGRGDVAEVENGCASLDRTGTRPLQRARRGRRLVVAGAHGVRLLAWPRA